MMGPMNIYRQLDQSGDDMHLSTNDAHDLAMLPQDLNMMPQDLHV